MTSLEATLPQTAASIGFDAKSEFGRSAESTDDANGAASETGMAALLGMWVTIFQQQVLPEPVAVEAGTAWQEGGSSAVAETQTFAASGAVEESSRGGKGTPVLAADILGLVGGQAVQASILWAAVQEPVEATVVEATVVEARVAEATVVEARVAKARDTGPEAKPLPGPEASPQQVLPALPFVSTLPVPVKETPVVESSKVDLPVPVAKKEVSNEDPAIAAVVEAFEPMLAPQKSNGSDAASERIESEKVIAVNPAPAPAAFKVVPTVEPPPLETVVNLKRKVSERILPKTLAIDVQPAVNDPIKAPSKSEPTQKELPEMTATVDLREPGVEAEAPSNEEPKLALEQPIPDAAPREGTPILKASAEEPAPAPAPHSLDPAPRAPSVATPPPAPVPQRSKATFVPEPPPAPPASREAKTISIRIPLNDSSAATGTPVRHLDLIFNQRNNDLTLQFNSPNTEIQGRIEESMPTLLNKLQTENWTAPPAELAANVAQPDLGFDGRRRAEGLLPPANQFDSLREPIATAGTSSQAFNFDDSPADRKDAQEQNQQGRNRKKEQAWQNEFDEQLEP